MPAYGDCLFYCFVGDGLFGSVEAVKAKRHTGNDGEGDDLDIIALASCCGLRVCVMSIEHEDTPRLVRVHVYNPWVAQNGRVLILLRYPWGRGFHFDRANIRSTADGHDRPTTSIYDWTYYPKAGALQAVAELAVESYAARRVFRDASSAIDVTPDPLVLASVVVVVDERTDPMPSWPTCPHCYASIGSVSCAETLVPSGCKSARDSWIKEVVGTRSNATEVLDPVTGTVFWMHDYIHKGHATVGGKESNKHACTWHKILPVRQNTGLKPVPSKCADAVKWAKQTSSSTSSQDTGGNPKRRCVASGCGMRVFDDLPAGDKWLVPHVHAGVVLSTYVSARLALHKVRQREVESHKLEEARRKLDESRAADALRSPLCEEIANCMVSYESSIEYDPSTAIHETPGIDPLMATLQQRVTDNGPEDEVVRMCTILMKSEQRRREWHTTRVTNGLNTESDPGGAEAVVALEAAVQKRRAEKQEYKKKLARLQKDLGRTRNEAKNQNQEHKAAMEKLKGDTAAQELELAKERTKTKHVQEHTQSTQQAQATESNKRVAEVQKEKKTSPMHSPTGTRPASGNDDTNQKTHRRVKGSERILALLN
jgi:hypothetical protein